MAESIKNAIERSPTLWVLTTLSVGFMTGVGAMRALEQYSGVVMVTQSTRSQEQVAFTNCRSALSSTTELNNSLRLQLQRLQSSVAQSQGTSSELDQCRVELARKGEFETHLKVSTQFNQSLQRENGYFMSPAGKTPIVVYEPKAIPPNELIAYFDGALTVVVRNIYDETACLSLGDMAECNELGVGQMLRTTVGGNLYGIRLDKLYMAGFSSANSASRVTLTVLLLR